MTKVLSKADEAKELEKKKKALAPEMREVVEDFSIGKTAYKKGDTKSFSKKAIEKYKKYLKA